MSLSNSFFVSGELFERPVTLPDGSIHNLHFKQVPAIEFNKFHDARKAENADVRATATAHLICASLCEPDGKPALSLTKAKQLTVEAQNALLEAVYKVNRPDDLGNASAPEEKSGSGTSSLSL